MKKVCVITGGGSGMGLATAKLICEEGYYTILVGRTLRWPNTPPNAAR